MATLSATVDQIRAEARQIDATKVVLSLLLLPLFVVGWTAQMVFRAGGWVLKFVGAAVKVGWKAAAPTPKGG